MSSCWPKAAKPDRLGKKTGWCCGGLVGSKKKQKVAERRRTRSRNRKRKIRVANEDFDPSFFFDVLLYMFE